MKPHGNRRVWTSEEIDYLKRNYYKLTNVKLAKKIGVSRHTIWRKAKELGLFKRPTDKAIEQVYDKPIKEVLTELHHEKMQSINRMSKTLGVARHTITKMMDKEGISYRNASEAQDVIWKNRTDEERKKQVKNAHMKSKALAEKGELSFQKLWRKKPDEMREIARNNALKMVKNRKRNGMKGRTGSRHPNWNPNRTKEYRIKFRKTEEHYAWVRDVYHRDKYTCQVCGYDKGGNLNAHHIFSYDKHELLRTEVINGITLCEPCHKEFHLKFGYGENNAGQFKDFIESKNVKSKELHKRLDDLERTY